MPGDLVPLTVTARLSSPPVLDRPIYLDAILLAGLGAEVGAAHPSGWVDPESVNGMPLPLARVESPFGWWWAASHAIPVGPEATGHLNRVPVAEEGVRWTTTRTLNVAAGADKRLRVPYYVRPGMLAVTWTAVGELERVAALLSRVTSVGRLAGHGHGWVVRWEVTRGGPGLDAYRSDLRLRHLPAELPLPQGVRSVARRQIPLRPPYHRRRDAVPCWQVQR